LLQYLTNSTKNACVSGYNVVSKTGTSEKRDTKRENDYVSSCVTFAPAEDPQIAILVTVDTPNTEFGYYGSVVAAPAVGRILAEVLPYMGIEPGESGKVETIPVGAYIGSSLRDAKSAIEALGLTVVVRGEGNVVFNQLPASGSTVTKGGTVILYTEEDMELKTTSMPDVVGSGVEAAKKALLAKGLNVRLSGVFGNDTAGCQVVSSSVKKGEAVPVGTVIVLECRYQSVND
ncbi:MAG: PASTA domain-containing protein, partial [Clostridiales bacterium]|nr:PASTA domain-containing protein [Candidatus Coliplasma caballi]